MHKQTLFLSGILNSIKISRELSPLLSLFWIHYYISPACFRDISSLFYAVSWVQRYYTGGIFQGCGSDLQDTPNYLSTTFLIYCHHLYLLPLPKLIPAFTSSGDCSLPILLAGPHCSLAGGNLKGPKYSPSFQLWNLPLALKWKI